MISPHHHSRIQAILLEALNKAAKDFSGACASYIPELANVPQDITLACITLCDGTVLTVGEPRNHSFTLQSVAKLVLLAGLLEEFGEKMVFSWVGTEPSGHDFSNISQLDNFGPKPSNPCVNAGAIVLCDHIPAGDVDGKILWLDKWMEKLFGKPIKIDQKIFHSESLTGYRNFALANLMKSNNTIQNVSETLKVYFTLCSYETTIQFAAQFAAMLANGGMNTRGERVLTRRTVRSIVSIMATSGLYDESGQYLMRTGMPAKSGVSGLIIATASGLAGISVFSPRINVQGGSVRGHIILTHLATKLGWHFATLRGP